MSLFMLKTGRSLQVLPSIISRTASDKLEIDNETAQVFIAEMAEQTNWAKDSLLVAKISQAHAASKSRGTDPGYGIGKKVLLATGHH